MKKLLALIMVLVLCLSLCACGGNKSTSGLSNEELEYVGTWTYRNDSGDTRFLRLESDGKAFIETQDWNGDSKNRRVGTWDIRGNSVIMYYNYDGTSTFDAYDIETDTLVSSGGAVYTK